MRWVTVTGFPDYEVSDSGLIRKWGQVLELSPRKNGYVFIGLNVHRDGNLTLERAVHVLVCSAFNGPRPSPAHEVAHRDGNPSNNRYKNLRWATSQENHEDAIRHGTMFKKLTKAQRDYMAKTPYYRGLSTELAEEWGVHRRTITEYYRKYLKD